MEETCPRCGGADYHEFECGDDSWDSYSHTVYVCVWCELNYHDWGDYWFEGHRCDDRDMVDWVYTVD